MAENVQLNMLFSFPVQLASCQTIGDCLESELANDPGKNINNIGITYMYSYSQMATVIVILHRVVLLLKSTEIGTYKKNMFSVQNFSMISH